MNTDDLSNPTQRSESIVDTVGDSAATSIAGACSRLCGAPTQTMDAEGCPDAPYANYTPLPGVIPPVPPPQYEQGTGTWCGPPAGEGHCVIQATQPIIPVPVKRNIVQKETVVEVDQVVITDKVQPNVWKQNIYHEVPKLAFDVRERKVDIPDLEIVEVQKEVEVPIGFNFQVKHSWEEREVPRLFPKYCGVQDVVEIGIPQIQIVDKKTDNEIPLYMGEKFVEKEVVEEEGVDIISYKYVKREEEVPVCKYRPVFDVEVNIPPPLVVPITVESDALPATCEKVSWDEFQRQRRLKKLGCQPPTDANIQTDPMFCGRRLAICRLCRSVACCCAPAPNTNANSSPPDVNPVPDPRLL